MSEIMLAKQKENFERDIDSLRRELQEIILEHDFLLHHVCKNLRTKYILQIGTLEYKLHEIYIEVETAKRKLELIQMRVNRQEPVCIIEIEHILEKELDLYRKELRKRLNQVKQALIDDAKAKLNSEEEREFKELYREIIKTLHPDLNPTLEQDQLELFYLAVSAYKSGDLSQIKIIYQLIRNNESQSLELESKDLKQKEIKRIIDLIDTVKEKIKTIKTNFPYTLKEMLENEKMLEDRKNEIEGLINSYRQILEDYSQRIELLLN
ncbi:MAG: hypothetical protein QM211_01775 [Bacillota bacterium]|jgi:hypothetical protein|nr:hypothetical protein [Bacillota bacterium]